jgi:protein subunit release factor A
MELSCPKSNGANERWAVPRIFAPEVARHTRSDAVHALPKGLGAGVGDRKLLKVSEERDLRIDSFCSSGPGGQSVNTTYSAVRVTHLPTNTVVQCQDEKSWHKNKARAMQVLRSRLYDRMLQEQQAKIAAERRGQIGSGDRSEKIRTYNFPQDRVTDHRIGMDLHNLPAVMDGELDRLIDALITTDQAERLSLFSDAG